MHPEAAGNRRFPQIQAILFDMDNTLFDFVAAKQHACRKITEAIGTTDPEALYTYFVGSSHGYESHENLRSYLNDRKIFSEERFACCCRIYEEEKVRVLEAYPAIHRVLEELKRWGKKLAIVTDAHAPNAYRRLAKLDLARFFDVVVTHEMTGQKKPALAPLQLALERLGTRPEETLLVGDSLRRDIAPGKALGLITAHARYGDRNAPSPTCTPDIILDSVEEILELL